MFPQAHTWGEMHHALQRIVPQHTPPTSQQCANINPPSSCSWYHIKRLRTSICQSSTESFWDTFWRRHPLLQKDNGQNIRTTTQPSFFGTAKDTNYFLWTQSVCFSHLLLICSPAQEQQEQGCSRTRAEWGAECDPCAPRCIPQHLNILGRACCWSQGPFTVLGIAKRPHPESDI